MNKLKEVDIIKHKRCRVLKSNLKKEIKNRLKNVINSLISQPKLITFKINIDKITYVGDILKKTCIESAMSHKSKDINIKVYIYGLNEKDYMLFKTLCETDELLSVINFRIDKISHISPIVTLRNDIKRINKIDGVKISIITNESFLGIFFNRKIVKNSKYFKLIFEISYNDFNIDTKKIYEEMSNIKNIYNGLIVFYNPHFTITETLMKSKFNFTENDILKIRNKKSINKAINTKDVADLNLKNHLINLYRNYNINYYSGDFNFFLNQL